MQTFAFEEITDTKMPDKKLGSLIRHLREGKGWTQRDLADRTGISQQSIAKWETGLASPRPANITTLAAALEIDPHQLTAAKMGTPFERMTAARNVIAHRRAPEADTARSSGLEEPGVAKAPADMRVQDDRESFMSHIRWIESDFQQNIMNHGLRSEETRVRIGALSYRFDYVSRKVIADLMVTRGTGSISLSHHAWRLAVTRAAMNYVDQPPAFVLIVLYTDFAAETLGIRDSRDILESNIRRIRAEAALLGVEVELVTSAEAAARVITARESAAVGEDTEDFGDDLI